MNPRTRKSRRDPFARRPPLERGGAPSPRPSLTEWLAVRMDVPADALGSGLRLDMRGRNTLTVHGCTKILDFSPQTIRLRLEGGALVVGGERLVCTSYLAGAVGIEGYICSITFCDLCDGEVAP